jgi:uncharacterized protein (DUF924 family)
LSLAPKYIAEVLSFWFETAGPKTWFAPDDALDGLIRARFEALSVGLAAQTDISFETPQAGLAIVIMLDQFPRNMYRGTAAAFAWDDKALACADIMTHKRWDLKLSQRERAFIYMPYMHAEDRAAQAKCVDYVDRYLDDENTLFHAQAHQKIIEDFGRFPHRNDILKRESTVQELTYLTSGGYRP